MVSCANFSNHCQLALQLLLLFSISLDIIFCCISANNRKYESRFKPFNRNQPQQNQNHIISHNNNINQNTVDERYSIAEFQKYLHKHYSWNIQLSELEFLWSKFQEFSVLHHQQKSTTNNDDSQNLHHNHLHQHQNRNQNHRQFHRSHNNHQETQQNPQSHLYIQSKDSISNNNNNTTKNVSVITISDINNYLDNYKRKVKIRGILGTDNDNRIVSRRRNKVFDYEEMTKALVDTAQYNKIGCALANVTFCVRTLLQLNNDNQDIYQVLPPGIFLQRCTRNCACIQPDQVCLPTGSKSKIKHAFSSHSENVKLTWLLFLTDHTGCQCQDRCANRKCIEPFKLSYSPHTNNCHCQCIGGREKRCSKLLEGFSKFSKDDYQCITKGKCLMPQCRYGPLTEENLYNRRCPR